MRAGASKWLFPHRPGIFFDIINRSFRKFPFSPHSYTDALSHGETPYNPQKGWAWWGVNKMGGNIMARLPYLEVDDVAPEDRDLLSRNISLHRALANSPNGARSFHQLAQWIRHQSRLDPRLRELAILQVGYMTRCAYEYSHHIKIGRDFGVSDDDIRAIIAETAGEESGLTELDRTALQAAREMTDGLKISDETFAVLRAHLDEERIVDLVMIIAFYNGVVRLLESLEIDVEPEYQTYLEEFPFPEPD
jgi:alkylhydroperoxidase family enzyme